MNRARRKASDARDYSAFLSAYLRLVDNFGHNYQKYMEEVVEVPCSIDEAKVYASTMHLNTSGIASHIWGEDAKAQELAFDIYRTTKELTEMLNVI